MNIIIAVAQSFLAGALTYFCSTAFKTLSGQKSAADLAAEQASSLLVVFAVMCLSLFSVDTGYLNIGRILAVLLTLILMNAYAVAGGVTGGVITGICSMLYDGKTAAPAAIIMIASFFGGISKPLGKTAQLAMLIVSSTTFTILAGAPEEAIYQMLDIFAASVLFAAVPAKITQKLVPAGEKFLKTGKSASPSVSRTVAAKLSMASGAIDDLSESVKRVSRRMDNIAGKDISSVYNKAADRICAKCGFKLLCWEDNYTDTMNSLNAFTKKLREKGEVELNDMTQEFKNRCCKPKELIGAVNDFYRAFLDKERLARNLSQSRNIAIEQFGGIADMLCEISGELSEIAKLDGAAEKKVKTVLDELGINAAQISPVVDKYGRMCVDIYTPDAVGCSLEILSDRLSDALEREFELPSVVSAGGKTRLSFFEQANFSIDFYTSQHSPDSGVCGDSYEFFVDAKGYAHLILSDGMGSGKRAAVDSVMTCSLLLKLIKAGFTPQSALKLINASLIVKSDDESLATLDIARFDLYLGTVSLYKAGAAATFIKKGGEVFKVESSTLPIGILRNIAFDKFTYKIGGGDVVVMASDGVISAGEDWIEAELELAKEKSAREISERILKEAVRRSSACRQDDMTVTAVKLSQTRG